MKICQICAVDFTLKTFLLPLIDAQISEGNEVISVCSDGKYIKGMLERGYRIKTISISRNMNIISHIRSTYKIFKFLKENKFDIVHVHTPIAAMIGRLAAFLARIPLVVYTAHGFYFHENMSPIKKYFFISLEILFGYITDLLFTQSLEDEKSAIKYGILSKDKVFTIGNGVDLEKFNPQNILSSKKIRNLLNIPSDAFVIGMISRLVKEKGVKEFLQAAEKIYDENNNCYFLLIGEHQEHDHAKGVEAALGLARNKLRGNLILTGYRSDIPELMSTMNLYVLPSWREGMPRSIIEAMTMSLPVLATDIRGSREEVIPNKTGWLVPVKSPELLAEGMILFIKNPEWAKELGLNGRKRALSHYDEQKVVSLQLKIIRDYMMNQQ
jgi:glycosyltransferase involved in cell wall biosynthesis